MDRLVIDHVSKHFGKTAALQSVSLQIGHGLFGLLGPNGAGKTTFMRVLATLLAPDSGSIRYNDIQWGKQSERVRDILGYLPQNFNVFKNISGYECLDYIGVLKGLRDKKQRRAQIETLLERVNLTAEAHKKTGHYSGGMKRRLGIAQALLGNPEIIIVDEPTAGLDPEERIRFRNVLREVATGRIIVLSTHIVEDIEATCSSVAVIKKGIATQFDSLSKLAQEAAGHVWLWKVRPEQAIDLQSKVNVISSTTTEDHVELRVLAKESPSREAIPVSPTLEEGYLIWNQR